MNLRRPRSAASNGCGTLSLSLSALVWAAWLCCTFWYLQVLCGQVSCRNAKIGHLLRDRADSLPGSSHLLSNVFDTKPCTRQVVDPCTSALFTVSRVSVADGQHGLSCCMWNNKGNFELICSQICAHSLFFFLISENRSCFCTGVGALNPNQKPRKKQ